MSTYFESEQGGFIELKYRKDSTKGYLINGEFKFLVNNKVVLVDSNYMVNSWTEYKY